jgi:putative ABC transport system permease protein
MDFHTRWFRRLVRLLPADFQADYARDMEHTFRAQQRDAAREQGGLARLWIETMSDLLRTAPGQHLDQLSQDVSYALRNLRRRAGASLAAIATLTIGIGSATAILSIVNAIDWRPLGYPDPDRVVFVQEVFKGETSTTTGYATFADWRERSRSFSELAAMGSMATTLSADSEAERVSGIRVTPGFFRVTGLEPAIGRGFTEAENRWDNRRFVVLSANLWKRRFGADPGIVGRSVQLGGRAHVVTGVMPNGVEDLIADRVFSGAEVWLPLGYDATLPFACRTCRHLRVVARLRPDVNAAQAQAEVDAITQQLAREHTTSYAGPGARVTRAADVLLGPVRPALYLLLAAVGVLLLMATVNVANLMLVRAVERGPEIATRRALGVASGRLVRQLLTESLVLAAAGALCALVFGHVAVRAVIAVAPESLPRVAQISLDGLIVALTAAIAATVGVLFGILPAWHLVSADVASYLRGARTTVSAGGRTGRVLVAGNVAFAVVLLTVTALLGRSFVSLLQVDPGFDPRSVTTASISLAGPAYAEDGASHIFFRTFLQRVSRPGDIAALTTQLPTDVNDSAGLHIHGRTFTNPEDAPMADRFGVTPDYFRAARIPVLRGRGFTAQDDAKAPRVAVINQTAAEQLFAGEDPIGQRISLGPATDPPREVVGIVGDVRHRGLAEPVTYQAYIPLEQFGDAPVSVVLRSADPLTAVSERIRGAVAAIDRTQVAHDIRSFDSIVTATLAERRFLLWLITGFAGAALALAVIGLYGIVSYVVAQRTRDIGLRVALGAAQADIRALVFRIGMSPVVAGVGVGLALVLIVTRPLERMLFAVRPLDVSAIGGAVAVLGGCALVACSLPARRATRVDPMSALRAE